MAGLSGTLALAGSGLGVLGGILLFIEFFQVPSYVSFNTDFTEYNVDISPAEVDEYTWVGRTGALLVALAFALHFVAGLMG